MKIETFVFSACFWIVVKGLSGQTPFVFNGQSILPGTIAHLTITLVDDNDYEASIPISIFHGTNDGPVLGITAGVHGYEYAPILANQQLIHRIDPNSLKGTIILVQIANLPSFLGRSPYVNPDDDKNLNRIFPGSPNGTITERIADFISAKVISRSHFFVDMHSGDAPEDLMAYAAYYQHDDRPEISVQGRQMAIHMGFDHIVLFKTKGKDYIKPEYPSLYCSAQAFKQGIPTVDIECGRLGIIEPHLVEKIVAGIESLLIHLGMSSDGMLLQTPTIAFIEERTSQSSVHTGFFYPQKSSGDYVIEGMKIGYITDFFGRTIQEVYAEGSGIILYMLGTPPVNKGETIINIGKLKG